MEPIRLMYEEYQITTDKKEMFPEDVHYWLSTVSYWAKYMPHQVFMGAFNHSFCIGAIIDGKQIAFARLITDYYTYGYLADVYVEEQHRGKGISKIMMEVLFGQDWVKSLRRIMLATKDAHDLYRKVGFKDSNFPERIMEIARPHIYGDTTTRC
jgi:GNAT superfamily N-acetyltransferase